MSGGVMIMFNCLLSSILTVNYQNSRRSFIYNLGNLERILDLFFLRVYSRPALCLPHPSRTTSATGHARVDLPPLSEHIRHLSVAIEGRRRWQMWPMADVAKELRGRYTPWQASPRGRCSPWLGFYYIWCGRES